MTVDLTPPLELAPPVDLAPPVELAPPVAPTSTVNGTPEPALSRVGDLTGRRDSAAAVAR